MADSRNVVELVFQGIDKTSEATRAALGNAAQLSEGIGNLAAPISEASIKAVKFEAALLATGLAITAFSIKAAGDFDEAFREISTLLDAPPEDLERFRQAILEYAATSTQALPSVTAAVYSAISAGVEYTESLEAISVAEQLAVAGKADLESALVLLVSSLNAYGEGMDSAERFSDALFTTVRLGQTTLPELAGSLSQVTSLAASAGVDFEELLAAIATLTAQGQPTSEAITAIRAALSNIISPTSQAAALAGELGIEFNATALETRGFAGVLSDVQQATGGNVETIAQLFGSVRGLTGVLALGGEGAEVFAENLRQMDQSAGAVQAAFEKMSGSITIQNQAVINSLQGLLIQIGTPLLDAYGNVAQALAAVFQAVGAEISEGQLSGLVQFIAEQMDQIAGILSQAAINLPVAFGLADLSALQGGIQAVSDAIAGLFRGFDLSTPQGLASAIEGLARAFGVLSEFTAGYISSFQLLFDLIADSNSDILDVAEGLAPIAGKIGGIATQIDAMLPAVNTLITVLTALAGIKTATLIPAFTAAIGSLATLATKLGPKGLIAGGFIYLGIKIYELVDGFRDLRNQNDKLQGALSQEERVFRNLADGLNEVADALGIQIDSLEDWYALLDSGAVVWDDAIGAWALAGDAVEEFGGKTDESLKRVGMSGEEAADALSRALAESGEGFKSLSLVIEDGEIVVDRFGDSAESAFDAAAASANRAIQESENYRLKMAQIASDERIAVIEAQFRLDAEQLIQETARIEAAFDSINVSIESTGDLLGSLTGTLTSTRFREEFDFVKDLIEREEARRDEAFRLQRELTQAQIDSMRARADALASGQALINIEGAGLQPHLEAFMWEILRTIQVRVNEDGMEMLLGAA